MTPGQWMKFITEQNRIQSQLVIDLNKAIDAAFDEVDENCREIIKSINLHHQARKETPVIHTPDYKGRWQVDGREMSHKYFISDYESSVVDLDHSKDLPAGTIIPIKKSDLPKQDGLITRLCQWFKGWRVRRSQADNNTTPPEDAERG